MLNNEQINQVNTKHTLTWKSFCSTIVYACRIRDKEHSIILPSQSVTDEHHVWELLFWGVFNRLIIAWELWHGRDKLFKLMFSDCSLGLSIGELKRIIGATSNCWLDNRSAKVAQFEDFCYDLFSDTTFWNDVCTIGNITSKKYKQVLLKTRQVFDTIYAECEELEQSRRDFERDQERWRRRSTPPYAESELQSKLYSMSFNDTSLLDESEGNQ